MTRLKLVDFVAKNDDVELEDFSSQAQERINDALANLTDTEGGPSPGGAGNIIVSKTRDTSQDGIFESIQSAIDNGAGSGDTVFVEPGTYPENVSIDKSGLTLRAAGPDETMIGGRVEAVADGVTLDGFTVSPPPATSNSESEAIRISNTPNAVTIMNNVVDGFERDDSGGGFYGVDGINIFGGDEGTPIENATVTNNEVRGLRNADQGGVAGISIQGNVDGATVEDNIVSDLGGDATHYGFGVVIRGTGNHDEDPETVDVVDNRISGVASDDRDLLGVGFSVNADGTDYLFENNDINSVELGVEIKAAAGETTFDGNTIGGTELRLGDTTGGVSISDVFDKNDFDGAAATDSLRVESIPYEQAIFPTISSAVNVSDGGSEISVDVSDADVIKIELSGAGGESRTGRRTIEGGAGGYVSTSIDVTNIIDIGVYVGRSPVNDDPESPTGGKGWLDGGAPVVGGDGNFIGGGGGGATAVIVGEEVVAVAGGGGGGADWDTYTAYSGGGGAGGGEGGPTWYGENGEPGETAEVFSAKIGGDGAGSTDGGDPDSIVAATDGTGIILGETTDSEVIDGGGGTQGRDGTVAVTEQDTSQAT